MRIAGKLTTSEWAEVREILNANLGAWNNCPNESALALKFFDVRIDTRFLGPMYLIKSYGKETGEGFAIVAIQCMLIEFLETLRRGLIFNPDGPNNQYEYDRTIDIFRSFLTQRTPFSTHFTRKTAIDF